jgi:hypothetical protein
LLANNAVHSVAADEPSGRDLAFSGAVRDGDPHLIGIRNEALQRPGTDNRSSEILQPTKQDRSVRSCGNINVNGYLLGTVLKSIVMIVSSRSRMRKIGTLPRA